MPDREFETAHSVRLSFGFLSALQQRHHIHRSQKLSKIGVEQRNVPVRTQAIHGNWQSNRKMCCGAIGREQIRMPSIPASRERYAARLAQSGYVQNSTTASIHIERENYQFRAGIE